MVLRVVRQALGVTGLRFLDQRNSLHLILMLMHLLVRALVHFVNLDIHELRVHHIWTVSLGLGHVRWVIATPNWATCIAWHWVPGAAAVWDLVMILNRNAFLNLILMLSSYLLLSLLIVVSHRHYYLLTNKTILIKLRRTASIDTLLIWERLHSLKLHVSLLILLIWLFWTHYWDRLRLKFLNLGWIWLLHRRPMNFHTRTLRNIRFKLSGQ